MLCPRCGFESWYRAATCPNCYEPWELEAMVQTVPRAPSLATWREEPVVGVRTGTPFDAIGSGHGVPLGVTILLAGPPGIGKTTLALWLAHTWPRGAVWYAPIEEGIAALKQKAVRLGVRQTSIFPTLDPIMPMREHDLLIIDSLHAWVERDGLLWADAMLSLPKITKLLLAHVTKEDDVRGPETLQHLVDVVIWLSMDGDTLWLSCPQKNRGGPPFRCFVRSWPPGSSLPVWPSTPGDDSSPAPSPSAPSSSAAPSEDGRPPSPSSAAP